MDVEERVTTVEQGFVVDALGLQVIDDELSRTQWVQIGRFICVRIEGSTWALADWLIAGGRADRDWVGGSTYEKASEITGYSKSHLSNAYRTGIAFPRERRRNTLSYSVHREAVRLPEEMRGEMLDLAEANRWSAEDLVAHINKIAADRQKEVDDNIKALVKRPQREYYRSPEVQCPNCKSTFPIKGHKVNGESKGKG